MKSKTKKIKDLKLIIFILAVCIIAYNVIYIFPIMKDILTQEGREIFKESIISSGIGGILKLLSLQIAQIFLVILPGEPLEILAGMCYGAVGGTLFILVSVFITTAIIVYLVRKFGRNLVYEFFNKKKVDKIRRNKTFKNPKKVEIIMFVLFFIPGTPKDLLVYLGGILPINPVKFILISTFARFPSVISSTLVGSNIVKGDFVSVLIIYVITFIFVIGAFALIRLFDKNKEAEKAFKVMK